MLSHRVPRHWALYIFLSIVPFVARATGPAGTGGGNLEFPSEKEVKQAIEEVWKYPVFGHTVSDSFEVLHINIQQNANEVTDPILNQVIAGFYNEKLNVDQTTNGYPIHKALQRVRYEINPKDACYHLGQPKASSVIYNDLDEVFGMSLSDLHFGKRGGYAKLCYSMPLLFQKPAYTRIYSR